MDEIEVFGEVACLRVADVGVDLMGGDTPVGPLEAIVEWLHREPCAVCGQHGCVVVDGLTLISYANPDEPDGIELETFTPEVCPYCDGTGTDQKAGVMRILENAPPGAVVVGPDGSPLSERELHAMLADEPCSMCGETDGGASAVHDLGFVQAPRPPAEPKVSRNAPCPCGSGVKHKRCCGR